jgi:hypothetical protein
MSTCQQALEEWNQLDCAALSPLCKPCITPAEECAPFKCKKKTCPCGDPGCPSCPKHCPAGESPAPCLPGQAVDPASGCCFTLPILPPPQCGPYPLPPCNPCFEVECPGQCPDGSPPPCLVPISCSPCPDGSIPEPPNCTCPQLCPDGTPPPCPVTKCVPCPNGSVPTPPECACPCPSGHAPPCLNCEALDLGTGCCDELPETPCCAPGQHPAPCSSKESLDPLTGCCNYLWAGFWDTSTFAPCSSTNHGTFGFTAAYNWPAVLASILANPGAELCAGPVYFSGAAPVFPG